MLEIHLFRVSVLYGQNEPLHNQRGPHRQGEHHAARLRQARAHVLHPQRRGQRGLHIRAAEAEGRSENCDIQYFNTVRTIHVKCKVNKITLVCPRQTLLCFLRFTLVKFYFKMVQQAHILLKLDYSPVALRSE